MISTLQGQKPTKAILRKVLTTFRQIREHLIIFFYEFSISHLLPIKKKNDVPKNDPLIHVFYIACKKDFEYLVISLKSLIKFCYENLGNIYIYVDKKDLLSEEQIGLLKRDFAPYIIIRTTRYPISWGGARLLISELLAYREINSEIKENHFVLKSEPDVLFISDKVFHELLKNNFDVLGQDAEEGFMQGGSCFLKNSVITKMIQQPIYKIMRDICKTEWVCPLDECPEDRAISRIVKQSGFALNLSHYSLRRCNQNLHDEISMIHFSPFVGLKKERMRSIWQQYEEIG